MKVWLLYLPMLLVLSACVDTANNAKQGTASTTNEELALDETSDLPFPVYDYEGLQPLLEKEDNKTYIINFWATWCKPCLEEMPYFQKTYEEQKGNGVELVLVSLDMPTMWQKRLVPYVKEKDLKGEVVILDDPKMNEWIPKIAENWGGGIPATLIYNANKRAFYERGFTYEELNTELEKFIVKK